MSKKIKAEVLCASTASILGVEVVEVAVSDISEISKVAVSIVDTLRGGGEFPQTISVYLAPQYAALSEADFARGLCSVLGVSCLISDDSNNPYRWWHVDSDGVLKTVHVQADSLDKNGVFCIDRRFED